MKKEKHFHLLPNRISPAVVAVIATIASIQFFFPGPYLDLQIPTDRLVQHLAHTHKLDAHISMTTGQLPDKVHPTVSETKYHVFNNQITDNVDIYHSEATTLIPKACTMKYTKKHKGTYRNNSYTTSKPRDFIRTFTILLIPTIQLQMR